MGGHNISFFYGGLSQHPLASRGLDSHADPQGGLFTKPQVKAIMITGLVCALLSLIASLIALRWFLLMRKCFRHRLILYLIGSDALKAVWYFVFPVVSFARGPIKSSSSFCQASGFMLAYSVEASDFAILVIAFHTILCIFRPNHRAGEGGVYPYRRWVYVLWLGLPLISASLAFVNPANAYVTAGTLCYLPKRPFWYRLALSWVPRYLIVMTIFVMYASIWIYVYIKFRGFGNLRGVEASYGSSSASRNSLSASPRQAGVPNRGNDPSPTTSSLLRPTSFRMQSFNSWMGSAPKVEHPDPWDGVQFITSRPLRDTTTSTTGRVTAADFGSHNPESHLTDLQGPARQLSIQYEIDELSVQQSRKASIVPTLKTDYTGETMAPHSIGAPMPQRALSGATDQLRDTRVAIRRQLNFLFLYPAIYVLMWTFPFASHALNYSDYYVAHPPFWLTIVATCMLALQAGVDCIVFSWRERPWRRIDCNSRLRLALSPCNKTTNPNPPAEQQSLQPFPTLDTTQDPNTHINRVSHWWEVEGRKRKDSVWMGTDSHSNSVPRRDRGYSRGGSSHEQVL